MVTSLETQRPSSSVYVIVFDGAVEKQFTQTATLYVAPSTASRVLYSFQHSGAY